MTERQRELWQLPGVAHVERTRGGHFRLTLTSGSFVFTASTPSDGRRAMINTLARVRRVLEQQRGRNGK
jgi:hypothetical protein